MQKKREEGRAGLMVGKEEQTVRLAAQIWSLPERQQARLPAQHCLAGLESWCQVWGLGSVCKWKNINNYYHCRTPSATQLDKWSTMMLAQAQQYSFVHYSMIK